MITKRPSLALIAGPTASGKSALALELAQRTGGVLVNADSAQVYRDLPVLSAAPGSEDLKAAEHRLYGALDGAASCSAADWAIMARTEIADIHASGRLPILVGGTGLYIRTLLFGIAPVPAIDADIREQVRAAPVAENHARLSSVDPSAAGRLKASDTTRIARALEVALSTGKPLSHWQNQRTGGIGDEVNLKALVLLPDRAWLYTRCDERFENMIDCGAIQEVQVLLQRKLDPDLPVMRAIGVRELAQFIAGTASLEEAVRAGQQATRRYAKRQYTWFANQPAPEWARFTEKAEGAAVKAALDRLRF